MSRRDNGLPASSYARLMDVETHVVDGLLERLADEGVAAYVAPASGRRGPYGDTVLPESPSDSVYVDSDRRDQARTVAERYLADVRDELAWAGILAAYDEPNLDVVPRWPASEDIDPEQSDRSSGRLLRAAEPGPSIGFEELREAVERAPREEPEEHYEPPPPPPIPVPDIIGRFAWAAALGGPLFLIVATLLRVDVAGWPGFVGLAAFVGGFVTLVARMKDRPPTDLGGDDGAVV